jgi:hypothetical protein
MSGLNMNRRKGSSQAVKKMIIKPFAMAPKLPENFEDDTWDKLKAATLKVHANEPVSYSQEELYRAVEDLCLHKMGAKLYERLQEVCDAHAGAMVQQIQSQSDDPSAFLGHLPGHQSVTNQASVTRAGLQVWWIPVGTIIVSKWQQSGASSYASIAREQAAALFVIVATDLL